MIVTTEQALEKINSPHNLMNRLRSVSSTPSRSAAMGLFGVAVSGISNQRVKNVEAIVKTPSFNPFQSETKAETVIQQIDSSSESTPPGETIEQIMPNAEEQVNLALAHDNALKTLNTAITRLGKEVDNVKVDKLPSVITATAKVVESIRKERLELTKANKDRTVHHHFYMPEQKRIEQYNVIDV